MRYSSTCCRSRNNHSSRQFPSQLWTISSGGAWTPGWTHPTKVWIPLSVQNGWDHVPATDTAEVAPHLTELHVHLRPYFLHALHHAARLGHQMAPVSPQAAHHPDLIAGRKAVIQQTKSVQLQQPLTL